MAIALDSSTDALRQKTLETAKRHKASWIELGQYLYSIQKDKLFKQWGFLTFETYCKKELDIKETTAAKLLKSYFFLEQEEPRLAAPERLLDENSPKVIPHYESVNLLRLAKDNKKLTTEDFSDIRQAVISEGREPKDVRAHVKKLLSDREIKDPSQVRRERRNAAIKRLVTMLGNTRREMESEGLLPDYLIKQINELASKLQDQIEP
jgi:hypothetical protein